MIEIQGQYNTARVFTDSADEAPQAYRPIDEIIANIEPTCDIINTIKPIYNFKAS